MKLFRNDDRGGPAATFFDDGVSAAEEADDEDIASEVDFVDPDIMSSNMPFSDSVGDDDDDLLQSDEDATTPAVEALLFMNPPGGSDDAKAAVVVRRYPLRGLG